MKIVCPTCNGLKFVTGEAGTTKIDPDMSYSKGNLYHTRPSGSWGAPAIQCKECKGQGWIAT